MNLSNRDIKWAVECGTLIIDPPPEYFGGGYDECSVDLHLDAVENATVWDVRRYAARGKGSGNPRPELMLGAFDYRVFSKDYLVEVPEEGKHDEADGEVLVYRKGLQVVVRPRGFLLWMTKEKVGTPEKNPQFVCFVNAKSTRARTGIVVHFTAPTPAASSCG